MQEHPLRVYRHQKGISLRALAKLARTSKTNLARIEMGVHRPSFDLTKRLHEATGGEVTYNDLFDAAQNVETQGAA